MHTQRIHSAYTAHKQRIHSAYTADTQRIHNAYTAHTQRIHSGYTADGKKELIRLFVFSLEVDFCMNIILSQAGNGGAAYDVKENAEMLLAYRHLAVQMQAAASSGILPYEPHAAMAAGSFPYAAAAG